MARAAWLLVLLALAGEGLAATVQAVDDRGKIVVLQGPARRIVALAPHVTELVFAAGAGDRLVGVTAFSDYPEAAKALPVVGDYGNTDPERILQLHPDLVIAWQGANRGGDVSRLERLGLPVFVTDPHRLDDIPRLLEAIGRLAGTEEAAGRAAADFRARWRELSRRYAHRRPVRLFYEIWHEPLMTVNDANFIGDVIRLCGGRNVFGSAPTEAPAVGLENVLAENPEAIIVSGMGRPDPGARDAWRRFPRLAAVRGGHLFFIPPDLLQRPTPRILQGAGRLCGQLEQVRTR
jgi:iron complex transport system substrate-binding protein